MVTQEDSIKVMRYHEMAILSLNRPDIRNAFDDGMIQMLHDHLKLINEDASIRTVVLTGEGEHFCAGANIEWMRRQAQRSETENYEDALKLAQLLEYLNELSKPTIAVIQGSVYGGGIGLVAACDVVLAAPNTTFRFSEVTLGLVPAVVGPYVLEAIGSNNARHWMLTALPFLAEEAKRLGLVHEIHPINALKERATELSSLLSRNAPTALGLTKELIRHLSILRAHNKSPVEFTAKLIAELRASQEGQEGLSAFLEKRNPNWNFTKQSRSE